MAREVDEVRDLKSTRASHLKATIIFSQGGANGEMRKWVSQKDTEKAKELCNLYDDDGLWLLVVTLLRLRFVKASLTVLVLESVSKLAVA